MLNEIRELMERIDPASEKILLLSTKCTEFISNFPYDIQKLIDLWSKTIEISPQKLSFLFLCNDILRNSSSETLLNLFQFSLPRAISLTSNETSSIEDIKKLIKLWGERQYFSRQVLDDWEKICERAEQYGNISNRSNFMYVINFGKKMLNLRIAQKKTLEVDRENRQKALEEEHQVREELPEENTRSG
ncbi:hypothetical protein SteCoe_19055 [Stentor coeruleus]|uniref:CID domain-containing protein n=1 Tax=Stentor coeruleus TaxID=5963 RepID=A0A1R2BV55_9CILI|nr:hypothetical protein SteCoe_19055 [Stentor coeruleus]